MTNNSSPHLSNIVRALMVAALAGAGAVGTGCGPASVACTTNCLAIAGTWTVNTTSASPTGSCSWANSNGTMVLTQSGSSITLSMGATLIVGASSLPIALNATGTLYDNGSFSAFTPQSSLSVNTTTIVESDNFSLAFTGSTAVNDAGAPASRTFTGSWGTTEQQKTGTSAAANCSRTASVSGSLN
jgi:hypothetical protein